MARKRATRKKAAAKKAARKTTASPPTRKKATAGRGSRKKATRKKTTRKKAAQTATGASRLRPAPGEIIVRMYRHGLGDCFLIAISTQRADDPRYILVDCGVHMRQVDGTKRLNQVMEQIEAAVDGHLHAVVATHEHADHLSGFVQKGSPFLQGRFEVDQLWIGWTERVGDTQADRLREKHGIAREILEAAIRKATNPALKASIELRSDFEQPDPAGFDEDQAEEVLSEIKRLAKQRPQRQDILDALTNLGPGAGLLGAAAKKKKTKPSSNELALGLLAMLAEEERYGEPGAVLTIPGADQVRAYVLGPPRNEKLLKKDRPSRVRGGHEHEYKETYLSAGAAARSFALSPALNGVAESGSGQILRADIEYPFSKSARRPIKNNKVKGPHGRFFGEHYFADAQGWRSIEDEWLAVGEQLALNLDSDTNNTSLVLAFEIGPPGEGRVLLFPGDAQVGNWLSWRDQTYSAGGKTVSVDDLLRRTLVYKVGHHGSHNATLKRDPRDESVEDGAPFGLELMDDIIAMIPVDRAAADRKMPTPWRMPHRPLYERLREKARLRVLRSDLQLKPLSESAEDDLRPADADWEEIPGKAGLSWRRSKETFKQGTAGPLFFDIRIPLGS